MRSAIFSWLALAIWLGTESGVACAQGGASSLDALGNPFPDPVPLMRLPPSNARRRNEGIEDRPRAPREEMKRTTGLVRRIRKLFDEGKIIEAKAECEAVSHMLDWGKVLLATPETYHDLRMLRIAIAETSDDWQMTLREPPQLSYLLLPWLPADVPAVQARLRAAYRLGAPFDLGQQLLNKQAPVRAFPVADIMLAKFCEEAGRYDEADAHYWRVTFQGAEFADPTTCLAMARRRLRAGDVDKAKDVVLQGLTKRFSAAPLLRFHRWLNEPISGGRDLWLQNRDARGDCAWFAALEFLRAGDYKSAREILNHAPPVDEYVVFEREMTALRSALAESDEAPQTVHWALLPP